MTVNARASTLPLVAVDRSAAPRKEDDAAQLMWAYYRDHKQKLMADIRLYRADILAQLMAGLPPEVVFAPYARPTEPVPARRRTA